MHLGWRQQSCEFVAEAKASEGPQAPSRGRDLDFAKTSFLGITVHAMTLAGFHQAIASAIDSGQKCLIAHHNLHSLYLLQKDTADSELPGTMQRFYKRAKWVQIDGMSLVLLARLYGHAVRREHRIALNVELPSLLKLAQARNWRILYLGSSEAVSAKGGAALRVAHPGLNLETHHGYFNKEQGGPENQAVLAKIAAFQPHVLFVGMGMPLQERWVEENYDAIHANAILTSGASLDYFAGALPIPPRWVGRCGLEWAYRLVHEPGRLGFRYLGEPSLLLAYFVKAKLSRSKTRKKTKEKWTSA